MKKVYYILALAATVVCSCSQNEELSIIETPDGNENTIGQNSLTASFDGSTRTMSTDGITTNWVSEDIIYVYDKSSAVKFQTHQGGHPTAIFAGTAYFPNLTYAVYGPTSSPTSSPRFEDGGEKVTGIIVPSSWAYDPTKNCANCIMMGLVNTTNYTVAFKNAGAILYITLGSEISLDENTSLTVTTATTPITGAATVNWNNGAPEYTCSDGGKTITITGLSGISGEKKIIIPMPVFTDADVITVKLVTTTSEETSENLIFYESAKLERNKYYCIEYTTSGVQTVFSEAGLTAAISAGNKAVIGKEDITLGDYALPRKLAENSTEDNPTYEDLHVRIDLNGKTLTATKITTNGNTLSITGETTDSELKTEIVSDANLTLTNVNLTGHITSTGGNNTLTNVNLTGHITSTGGNNTLTNVNLTGHITSTGGNNTLNGVKINSSNDYGISATAESYPTDDTPAPKYIITNCEITAKKTAVYLKYTDLVIKGSTLTVSAEQTSNDDGTGYCIAVMGGENVDGAPAKGSITLGATGSTNIYHLANGDAEKNNVYIFANEDSHLHSRLTLDNKDQAKIAWKVPHTESAGGGNGEGNE